MPHCGCHDWRHFKLPCKHFCACMKAFPEWGWDKLSRNYTDNPLFCLDEDVVTEADDTAECITAPSDVPTRSTEAPDTDLVDDFAPLPPKHVFGKNSLRVKCRNIMKELSGLTYLIKDCHSLQSLADDLSNLLQKTRSLAPNDSGIHLKMPSPCKSKKRRSTTCNKGPPSKTKDSKLLNLSVRRYGRPKHPYSGRVGKYANMMKTHYRVKVPVPTTSTNKAPPHAERKPEPMKEQSSDKSSPKSKQTPKPKPAHQSTSTAPGRPSTNAPSTNKPPPQCEKKPEPMKKGESSNSKPTQSKPSQQSGSSQANGRPTTNTSANQSSTGAWVNVQNVRLSQIDRTVLVSGADLNDKHIHAVQKLLKKQFPNLGGLIDPIIVSNQMIPTCRLPSGDAMQIHHVPGHWLMSCCYGGSVTVYDSMTPSLTTCLKQQLQAVYKQMGSSGKVTIILRSCQRQVGSHDCGLFAIANAIALANGTNPATVSFYQNQMRQHLLDCLESQCLTMFPHVARHGQGWEQKI